MAAAVAVACPSTAYAAPPETVLEAVAEVHGLNCTTRDPNTTESRQGTGFFWKGTTSVVTALHVVSGCTSARIRYRGGEYPAAAVRFVLERDLAELQLKEAVNGTALSRSTDNVVPEQKLYLVGHHYSINTPDAIDVEVTLATVSRGTLQDLLDRALHPLIKAVGIDLKTRIVRIRPGVQPGASGAPALNSSGDVVGIGHGRLSADAGHIGWITRASYLADLERQTYKALSQAPNISVAFLSGVTVQNALLPASSVKCGQLTVHFRWTLTLGEILRTHNDPKALREIIENAAKTGLAIEDIAFDVWHESETGAYVVVPRGYQLAPKSDRCIASSASDPNYSLEILGLVATSPEEARRALDLVARQEQRAVERPINLELKMFANRRHVLDNGAMLHRRAYGNASPGSKFALTQVAQTGIVRGSTAVVVLGKSWMPMNQFVTLNFCATYQWRGPICAEARLASIHPALPLLGAALSTVPDS